MKKIYFLFAALLLSSLALKSSAQITFDNVPPLSGGGNTAGGVCFNFTTNASITVQNLRCAFSTASGTATVWYKTTKINGAPSISVANGWVSLGSATFAGLSPSTTSPVVQTVPVSLNLIMQPQDTFGFFIQWTGNVYPTPSIVQPTYSNGTVTIIADATCAFTGTGTTPTFNPRQINGGVIYTLNAPCSAPPTAGTAVASPFPNACIGSTVGLSLSGNSNGMGLTVQWESSPALAGPYTPISSPSSTATYSVTATTTQYYRAAVTCSGQTDYSVPVLVTVPTPFPGGVYDINSAIPTGGTNFQSFADAISAIGCGISGPIVLNVASGSGPYNEQVNIPPTVGSNAANTVTINGNGATLTQTLAIATSNFATLNIDGADYVTVNNLNIEALGGTYGFGVHLMNSADNNSFNNCNISASTTATGTTSVGVSMSGSTTLYSTAGANGSNNTFTNCNVVGGYFGFAFYGGTPAGNTNNSIINCTIKEFYGYGSYNIQQGGSTISGNLIERPTRTTTTTFYGVMLTTGCTNILVEKNTVRNAFTMLPTSTSTAYPLYCGSDGTLGNENRFINNLVYNINNNGIVGGLYLTTADYVKAYHNTISLDYTASTAGATYGIYSTGTLGGIDIKNNNVSITKGGSGAKYCLYYTGGLQSSNNNNLYINSVGGTNFVGYNVAGVATLAAWQTANGGIWDGLSQSQNPLFVNPANGDFSVGNLALDDLGAPVGVLNDLLGNPRSPTTPDIGSLEFGNAPLATRLISISATNAGNRNKVNWSTGSEDKGDVFIIERSNDAGRNFSALGTVTGKGAASTYTYWDQTPLSGVNYYRIRMTDAANKATLSGVVSATVKDGGFRLEAYPNPVSDMLHIKAYGAGGSDAHVTVTDIMGKTVLNVSMNNGEAEVDMSHLVKGAYLIKYTDSAQTQAIKVTKR